MPLNGKQTEAAGMASPRRSKAVALGLILGLPALLFAAAAYRAVQLAGEGPVPVEMRDLDCDGRVSRMEWLRGGLDYDRRDEGQGCTAIFHIKTGRAVVYRCATAPRCRTARQWQPR